MHADQKAVYGEIHPGKWWLSRNVGNQHSSATSEICQEKKANLNKASLKGNPSFFPVLPEKKEKKIGKKKRHFLLLKCDSSEKKTTYFWL